MSSARQILFLDSCAIIEAHRTKCWKALLGRFDLHTVHECWDELRRGDKRDSEYIAVDQEAIKNEIVVHKVDAAQVTAARMKCAKLGEIDAGERELLAWCHHQEPGSLLLTTGDRAAIIAACHLRLDRALISLEEVTGQVGQKPKLQGHFSKVWLSKIRTECTMDLL